MNPEQLLSILQSLNSAYYNSEIDTLTDLWDARIKAIEGFAEGLKKDMFTKGDMINAHREGWRSAYYAGHKQHESSAEWVEEYVKAKQPQ